MKEPNEGTDADHGIEEGEFETSGVNDDVQAGEAKARGGEGAAKFKLIAHPRDEYAHKRPALIA